MNPSPEEALFALALAKPAAKRAAWLDAECDGDRIFVASELEGPVTCLDGATGNVIREYPETKGAEEINATEAKETAETKQP